MSGKTKLGLSDPQIPIPEVKDTKIGKMFGDIRLEELIGWGGMGEIYKGFHTVLQRYVAVKIPLGSNREYTIRMITEACSQFDLKGDHIVTVLGASMNPEPHIVMEYKENSETLEDYTNRNIHRLLDPEYLLGVFDALRKVFITLHRAHTRKDSKGNPGPIIHRDVKPGNILVVENSNGSLHPSVIDWGLAKIDKGTNLTSDGTIIGSLHFMAPEQARSNLVVGPKADVFSAALTTFYAVMGDYLYQTEEPGGNIMDLTLNELIYLTFVWCNDPEKPDLISNRLKDCPKWLERILAPALVIDPEKRVGMMQFVKLLEGGIAELNAQLLKQNGSVPSGIIPRSHQDDVTVEAPTLTEKAMKEMAVEKESSFGKKASVLLLGVLAVIAGFVAVFHVFGGNSTNSLKHKAAMDAPAPMLVSSAEVIVPPEKRARARPQMPKPILSKSKPRAFYPPPEGDEMPSDDYIDTLFMHKSNWCLKNGNMHETYDKSLTNYLGCMRGIIRHLFYTKHRGTAILLLDSTYQYFCFYPATSYDKTLKAECARAKQDKARYFKPLSGGIVDAYDKRLSKRVPVRNRIRRERRAWFKKKYNLN